MEQHLSPMRPYLVTFSLREREIGRYFITADTEMDARSRVDHFYREHPMFSMFDDDPDLTFTIKAQLDA